MLRKVFVRSLDVRGTFYWGISATSTVIRNSYTISEAWIQMSSDPDSYYSVLHRKSEYIVPSGTPAIIWED